MRGVNGVTQVDGERRGIPESIANAWGAVREQLRRDLGTRTFDHWLARVRLGAFCPLDAAVELVLPSPFLAKWVTSNYGDRLTLAWRAMSPAVRVVRLVAQGGEEGEEEER